MTWSDPTSAALRVLIADDNADFRDGMRSALALTPGLQVVAEAGSAEEALELAATVRPDVVLMDVAMPGMNGLEATGRLKARADAPCVIVVTLYDLPAYRAAALAAGADGFLPKADGTVHPGGEILRLYGASARGAARGARR